jgi:hypothetical protein
VVEWISPFVIGVFVGFLVDPWLRAWIMQNDWARQERNLETDKPSAGGSTPIIWSDPESLEEEPADPGSDPASLDEAS